MSTRLGIAALGAIGGLLLALAGAFALAGDGPRDWSGAAAIGGSALGLLALGLAGLAMVPRAPAWLRLIVCLGFPLLAVSVGQVVSEEVDGWRADAWTRLLAGVTLLAFGVLAGRRATVSSERYQPSHR